MATTVTKARIGLATSFGMICIAWALLGEPASAVIPTDPANLPAALQPADFYDLGEHADQKAELGRLLFFDKILSGNRNISCATCHHPTLASGDGLALGFGEGAEGLGPDRRPGVTPESAVHGRIPRNAPALFNLGAKEFTRLFHDGRVEVDTAAYYEGGFISPAKWKLPAGLDNVLAAQAMFPVTSAVEMAGQKGENAVADAASLNNAAGPGGVWEQLAGRLAAVPEYVALFKQAYPESVSDGSDITFVHAANAIAAFETVAFRADDSPFDRYAAGDAHALNESQRRGMALFYGEAGCSGCHSGAFQTDHEFHSIAMPQIGPGKGDGGDSGYWSRSGERAFVEDFGRGRVTVRPEDNFRFRTPSLRNVAMTGPWGHAGAYDELEDVVRHHLDPVNALRDYAVGTVDLPSLERVLEITAAGSTLGYGWLEGPRLEGFKLRDTWVLSSDALRARIADSNELAPVALSDTELQDLVAFLGSLSDPSSDVESYTGSDRNAGISLAHVPDRVPSGLEVDR